VNGVFSLASLLYLGGAAGPELELGVLLAGRLRRRKALALTGAEADPQAQARSLAAVFRAYASPPSRSSTFWPAARREALLAAAGLVLQQQQSQAQARGPPACWAFGEPLLDEDGNPRKSGLRRDAVLRSWHLRVTVDELASASPEEQREFPRDVRRPSRRAAGQAGLGAVKAWWFGEVPLPALKKQPFDLRGKAGAWLKHESGRDGPALCAFILQAAYSDWSSGGKDKTFRQRKGQLLTGGRAWCPEETIVQPVQAAPSRRKSIRVTDVEAPGREIVDSLFASGFRRSDAKLKHLVEKVRDSLCLRVFLSSPFDGCELEREMFMQTRSTS
jgi:hypothetical protein